jgi:hypothetical protein
MPRAEARKRPIFMAELDELLPDRTQAAEIASYLCIFAATLTRSKPRLPR